jgi:hypothetical protein
MSAVVFGPKDEAAQLLGKEISDAIQAAFKKGPGRWGGVMKELFDTISAGSNFQSLMADESDTSEESTFDAKKAAAQVALGMTMDNARDYMSLDS